MSQLFESRNINEFLGIGKDKLFHWVVTKRLIKPAKDGKGRGGRSKFSLENLLDLSLISELADFGVELNSIKSILEGKKAVWKLTLGKPMYETREFEKGPTPWEKFKENKELHEREGLWLEVDRFRGSFYWRYGAGKKDTEQIEKFLREGHRISEPKAKMVISISRIVKEIEEKTGMRI